VAGLAQHQRGQRSDVEQATYILLEANREADRVRREASADADARIRKAQEEARALLAEAHAELERLRLEISRLESVRKEVREHALAFLLAAYELVDNHSGMSEWEFDGEARAPMRTT
jgi:hypothetical protein